MFVQCPSEFRCFWQLSSKIVRTTPCLNISESLYIYRLLMWLLSNNFSWPEVLLTLIVVFRIPYTMPDVITWLKTFTKNCPLIWFSEIVQNLLPLSNQIPIWTLDKIGIPEFRFPIGTYNMYFTACLDSSVTGCLESSVSSLAVWTVVYVIGCLGSSTRHWLSGQQCTSLGVWTAVYVTGCLDSSVRHW